jgi:hypothetical protein
LQKVEAEKDGDASRARFEYEQKLRDVLPQHGTNITQELVSEALVLLDSGRWQERLKRKFERQKGRRAFFICPFGNSDIDRNYRLVIKPQVERHHFEIDRVDEISHSTLITDVILSRIAGARFIVADLTDARPNCYYEVGHAHALGKPVILLAQEGTERHFDIGAYRWNTGAQWTIC